MKSASLSSPVANPVDTATASQFGSWRAHSVHALWNCCTAVLTASSLSSTVVVGAAVVEGAAVVVDPAVVDGSEAVVEASSVGGVEGAAELAGASVGTTADDELADSSVDVAVVVVIAATGGEDEERTGDDAPASQPSRDASASTLHGHIVTDHSVPHPARAARSRTLALRREDPPGDRSHLMPSKGTSRARSVTKSLGVPEPSELAR